MKAKLVLAAALSLAACSTAPAAETASAPSPSVSTTAAAVNPVGRFEFTTSVQGQPVTGAVEISGTADAYTGQITTSITQPIPISRVTVNGQELVVSADTPDGPVTIHMTFTDANTFSGGWELAGDSGTLTGRRAS